MFVHRIVYNSENELEEQQQKKNSMLNKRKICLHVWKTTTNSDRPIYHAVDFIKLFLLILYLQNIKVCIQHNISLLYDLTLDLNKKFLWATKCKKKTTKCFNDSFSR